MTTSHPDRKPRDRPPQRSRAGLRRSRGQKSFTDLVAELRAYIDGLNKPLEDWTQEEHAEFRARCEGDSFALGAALAAPLNLAVSSEYPHRRTHHTAK